jgi:type I phosphodiesterase/nucleotide pyrophosphatase
MTLTTRTYALAAALLTVQRPAGRPPALVVLVAVDQMRGDYFLRFAGQWTGGFARLTTQGIVFANGREYHATTETAPGHSTMLSGREPSHTQIVSNNLAVQDPDAPVLGVSGGPGASPRRFHGTTLVDWMLARDPATRVLSVSRKSDAAILPIGRARADVYWFENGNFTTSRYYADTLPSWVQAFNDRRSAAALAGTTWGLLLPDSSYQEPDIEPFENSGSNFTFPHPLPVTADSANKAIASYPWMDSLTLAFALDGVGTLQLGRRDGPDLLSISLSTTDIIGHAFGPDSRELHDLLLRLDRYLGWFLDSLTRLVPANRIALALTGDHGVTSLPEYTVLVRHQSAGRIWLGGLASSLGQRLRDRYRVDFAVDFHSGLVSADVAALTARRVNVDSLAAALAAEVRRLPGIAQVYTPATLAAAPAVDEAARLWRRLIPADYGWLVCALPKPGYVWSSGGLRAEHGGAHAEDINVPVVFLVPGATPQHPTRPVNTVDIAPTLAALLGLKPTEPLDGVVLPEVLTHPAIAGRSAP